MLIDRHGGTGARREWSLRPPDVERSTTYARAGYWDDAGLGELLTLGVDRAPGTRFKVRSASRPFDGTYGDVLDGARRLAQALRGRGIGPGDVLAVQLPNWSETAVTYFAAMLLGAVVVPIVHFYRAKEIGHILDETGARVLVMPAQLGRDDMVEVVSELRPRLPELETVAVVGTGSLPDGDVGFESLLDGPPLDGPLPVDPGAPTLIGYTSGSTSDPKGAIHSHRTLGFELRQISSWMTAQENLTGVIVGTPIGHMNGLLALVGSALRRRPVTLIDRWDPDVFLATMVAEDASWAGGPTYFLTSLLDAPTLSEEHLALMRRGMIGLGGSTVPPAVCERATELGLVVGRSYGSTEHPTVSGPRGGEPADKRHRTDGRPYDGVEVRIVDDDGRVLATGEAGEIETRGPDCFLGYADASLNAEAFDADGWFATGDVGIVDVDGFLTVTDRKKDIIIRGGENISASEVEDAIVQIPGVLEVAVVGVADDRLGERVGAFTILERGAAPVSLDDVRAHLARSGLARQKWPEFVRRADELPRTPSGKVKKNELRRLALEADRP
jgi:acyl-CoA synthetase (AMP-forming)/AMP-acid ligase II